MAGIAHSTDINISIQVARLIITRLRVCLVGRDTKLLQLQNVRYATLQDRSTVLSCYPLSRQAEGIQ